MLVCIGLHWLPRARRKVGRVLDSSNPLQAANLSIQVGKNTMEKSGGSIWQSAMDDLLVH